MSRTQLKTTISLDNEPEAIEGPFSLHDQGLEEEWNALQYTPFFFKTLIDNLSEGIYFVDRNRIITYWNQGAERITGYPSIETVGHSCRDNILVHTSALGCEFCPSECPLSQAMRDGKPRQTEAFLKHKSGHRVPVQIKATPILGSDGKILGAVEVFNDITSKMAVVQLAKEYQDAAFLDELTGIGNRRYAVINLSQKLVEFEQSNWPFAVLWIDIDHFKQINDRYGHDAGDEVLKMTSKTLLSSLRSFDFLGRWGGEEFVAILANPNPQTGLRIAERCRALVAQSKMTLNGNEIKVTISIGVTSVRNDDTLESITKRADDLLYQSKKLGRNRTSHDLSCGPMEGTPESSQSIER